MGINTYQENRFFLTCFSDFIYYNLSVSMTGNVELFSHLEEFIKKKLEWVFIPVMFYMRPCTLCQYKPARTSVIPNSCCTGCTFSFNFFIWQILEVVFSLFSARSFKISPRLYFLDYTTQNS